MGWLEESFRGWHRAGCTLLAATLGLVGCGGEEGASPESEQPQEMETTVDAPGSTTFEVEWAPSTRVFEADFVEQSLIGVDAEAGGLLFDPSVTEFAALQPGDVVVLAGLGIGRFEGVETSPSGELLVKLGNATLPEAIQNGTIAWDQPLVPGDATQVQMADVGTAIQALTEPARLSTSIDGYQVDATFTRNGGAIELELAVAREIEGVKIGLTGKGAFRTVRSRTEIQIVDGQTESYVQSLDKISGELEVFGIGMQVPPFKKEFKIPLSWTIPMMVGPVPVNVQIGVEAGFTVEALGIGEAETRFVFNYDSDLGFSVEGGVPDTIENIRKWSAEFQEGDATSLGGVGVGVSVIYPRIKVSLFPRLSTLLSSTAVADFKLEAYQYSLFNFNVPCKEAQAKLEMRAAADFKLLGIPIASDEISLAYEKDSLAVDGEGCTF